MQRENRPVAVSQGGIYPTSSHPLDKPTIMREIHTAIQTKEMCKQALHEMPFVTLTYKGLTTRLKMQTELQSDVPCLKTFFLAFELS